MVVNDRVQETANVQEVGSQRSVNFNPQDLIESSQENLDSQSNEIGRTPRLSVLILPQWYKIFQYLQLGKPSASTTATVTKTVTIKRPLIKRIFPKLIKLIKSPQSSAEYEKIPSATTEISSSPTSQQTTSLTKVNLHQSTVSLENEIIPITTLNLNPTAVSYAAEDIPIFGYSSLKTYTTTTTVTSTRLQPSLVILSTTTYITTTAVIVSTVDCILQDYITSPCPAY